MRPTLADFPGQTAGVLGAFSFVISSNCFGLLIGTRVPTTVPFVTRKSTEATSLRGVPAFGLAIRVVPSVNHFQDPAGDCRFEDAPGVDGTADFRGGGAELQNAAGTRPGDARGSAGAPNWSEKEACL